MSLTVYHNPRCSKSRQTLKLLREQGVEPRIVEYLKEPPDAALLKRLLKMLGLSARDLLRRGEAAYKEFGLADPATSDDELIAAIVNNPILLERPIVVKGDKAVIGRPPENVLKLL
jgi:arsenate reductase